MPAAFLNLWRRSRRLPAERYITFRPEELESLKFMDNIMEDNDGRNRC